MDNSIMQGIVRIGFVTDTDSTNKSARVKYDGVDMTSGWLRVVRQTEDWMPSVNDKVVCIYLPVFNGDGFILGVV